MAKVRVNSKQPFESYVKSRGNRIRTASGKAYFYVPFIYEEVKEGGLVEHTLRDLPEEVRKIVGEPM